MTTPTAPTTQEVFTRIYETGAWNSAESASGTGSTMAQTEIIRDVLPVLISQRGIKTIMDISCGDWNWMQHVDLRGALYHGADIVPAIIEANQAKHAHPRRCFSVMDILTDPFPEADLILCRDCLCHFYHADAIRAIVNIRNSGGRYLLANFYPRHYANVGDGNLAITTGQWYPINLCAAPFRFPKPLVTWCERCPTPGYTDKTLGLWLVADLPWRLNP